MKINEKLIPKLKEIDEIKTQLEYKLVTDGNPVKTGRVIDGKDEYIKRLNLGSLPNATTKAYNIGITTSQKITKFELYGESATNEYIPFPRTTGQNAYVNYYINANGTDLQLVLNPTMDISRFTGYLEICYIEE